MLVRSHVSKSSFKGLIWISCLRRAVFPSSMQLEKTLFGMKSMSLLNSCLRDTKWTWKFYILNNFYSMSVVLNVFRNKRPESGHNSYFSISFSFIFISFIVSNTQKLNSFKAIYFFYEFRKDFATKTFKSISFFLIYCSLEHLPFHWFLWPWPLTPSLVSEPIGTKGWVLSVSTQSTFSAIKTGLVIRHS